MSQQDEEWAHIDEIIDQRSIIFLSSRIAQNVYAHTSTRCLKQFSAKHQCIYMCTGTRTTRQIHVVLLTHKHTLASFDEFIYFMRAVHSTWSRARAFIPFTYSIYVYVCGYILNSPVSAHTHTIFAYTAQAHAKSI